MTASASDSSGADVQLTSVQAHSLERAWEFMYVLQEHAVQQECRGEPARKRSAVMFKEDDQALME